MPAVTVAASFQKAPGIEFQRQRIVHDLHRTSNEGFAESRPGFHLTVLAPPAGNELLGSDVLQCRRRMAYALRDTNHMPNFWDREVRSICGYYCPTIS